MRPDALEFLVHGLDLLVDDLDGGLLLRHRDAPAGDEFAPLGLVLVLKGHEDPVDRPHQGRPVGRDAGAGGHELGHESVAPGVHDLHVGGFDDALEVDPVGRGDQPHGRQHDRRRRHRGGHRPGPDPQQFAARDEVVEELAHGHQDPRDDRHGGQEHAHDREEVRHEQQDRHRDDDAVHGGRHGVEQKPALLAARVRRVAGVPHAPHVPLDQVVEVILRPLGQVGDLQQVREDVVAVVPQQRVGVEQDRGHAGDEHDVVADGVGGRLGARLRPDDGRHRRNAQFHQHPGRAHHHPVPRAPQRPGAGGVDVRQRREDQEHDAHHVDLAAGTARPPILLARKGVAELVEHLHEDETHVQERQALGIQNVRGPFDQFAPPVREEVEPRRQQRRPQHETPHAEDRPEQPQEPIEEPVRVEERNADEQQVRQVALDLARDAQVVPAEQAFGVGRQVALEQVRRVQLAEQLDGLALGGGAVAQLLVADAPDLRHVPPPVEQPDEPVSRLVQPEELVVRRVLDDVPHLRTVMLPVGLERGPQARPQAGHAVPRLAEGRTIDRHRIPSLARALRVWRAPCSVARLACPAVCVARRKL